jgi:agmatinase
VTYRQGARFGPDQIRQASRLLKPYHPVLGVINFADEPIQLMEDA